MAIAPKYDEVRDFHEGVAAVRQGGQWRLIDKDGHPPFRLPSGITEIGDFADGLAPVKIGNQWGYMNHEGTLVIPPQYKEARPFQ